MAGAQSTSSEAARSCEWWIEKIDGGICLMTSQGPFSVYRRASALTGCGWDAQAASTLFATRPVRDILLLGMGGGTVARLCRQLHPTARIVAVEAEAKIITLARKRFGIDNLGLEVVHAQAEDYVRAHGGSFDAVVDDAWPFVNAQARAAVQDTTWHVRLADRLREGGSLAINLLSNEKSAGGRHRAAAQMRRCFVHLREIRFANRATTVLVGGNRLICARAARERMRTACGAEALLGMSLRSI